MMVDISVIIPAYNAEKTIGRCIESVLQQSGCSFELVVVNDGSQDNTLEIIRSYQERHPNILVIDQENKGLSRTKNVALRRISGAHFMILDSDDYLPLNIFSTMSKYFGKDLSLYSFTYHKNSKNISSSIWTFTGESSLDTLFSSYKNLERLNATMVRLFKTNIQKKYNLYYNIEARYSEDTQFNYNYYKHCGEIFVDTEVAYCVELTNNSLSRQFYGGKIYEMSSCYALATQFLNSAIALSNTFIKLYKNFALDEIGATVSRQKFIELTKEFHKIIEFPLVPEGSRLNNILAYLFNKKMYDMIYWMMLCNFSAVYKMNFKK